MKKITLLFMSILFVVTLAACGNQENKNNSQTPQPARENMGTENMQEPLQNQNGTTSELTSENFDTNPEAQGGKTLVVYYSASGNTETVASYIADAANADLFELVPVNPYSDADLDWTDDGSRVVYEHDNPDGRDVELVEEVIADWDSYDTVFIGYPNMEQGFNSVSCA